MKLPRIFHKWYANWMGYFWLSCPLCGRMFGGHEKYGTLFKNPHQGVCVCSNCAEEAERLNREENINA